MDVTHIDPFTLPSVELEQRDNLPAVSGIYFVITVSEVLYIGKATDLHQRWGVHHRIKQIQMYDGVQIAWFAFPVVKKADLGKLEDACIAHFNPLLNDTNIPEELMSGGRNKEKYIYPTVPIKLSSGIYEKLAEDAKSTGMNISDIIPVRLADYYFSSLYQNRGTTVQTWNNDDEG